MDRTITLQPASSRDRQDRPYLRLLYSPVVGVTAYRTSYVLSDGATHIRRDAAQSAPNDIVLSPDSGISRQHAKIEVHSDPQRVFISDCGSRNGTFVNGVKLGAGELRPLQDGDIVRVGSSFLILRWGALLGPDAHVPELVGVSPAMGVLRQQLAKIATDSATVLVLGETGTGKEVVSSALHRMSARDGARVAVNCSAIPEGLLESQFFGHVAGAFTGAKKQEGFFRAAHNGTLLLDEVGDLPLSLQPKLLRVLEDRCVIPVGATAPLPCDVRLLAATNRDLQQAINRGTFRADLYARLSDIVLTLPPLRERREDILLLLNHASDDALCELSADIVERLLLYAWPLNVREIQKIATHLRLFGPDAALRSRLGAAPASVAVKEEFRALPAPASPSLSEKVHQTPTRKQLEALLHKHAGVIQRVADELGCSRRQVNRWIDLLAIERSSFRAAPNPKHS